MIQLFSFVALLAAPLVSPGGASSQEVATVKAPERGAPFLWTIEGAEGRGYLFGTIHLPDQRVLALPKVVEAAFGESGAYYSEIESSPAVQKEAQEAAMLKGGASLPALIGPAVWDRVKARLTSKNASAQITEAMQVMEPWAVSSMLPALDYLEAQMKGQLPLDHVLYVRAQAGDKTVGGLESVQEQVGIFARLSQVQQVLMLTETLDMLDRYDADGKDAMEETVKAWLSGKETALLELMEDSFGHDEALRRRLEKELLWDRNRVLADRISGRLEASRGKVAFFAVGALHMPDAPKVPDGLKVNEPANEAAQKTTEQRRKARKLGLISLLRAKGYRVTRVAARAAMPAGAADK